jgi:cardiolipin synthase
VIYSLLVDEEFWVDLYQELASAQRRVFVQFMTFEADETGLELEKALIAATQRGVEVKVLIDYFTDYFVSDTFYRSPSVSEEVAETARMISRLKAAGASVKRTRPVGLFMQHLLARNHKKIIVIDDTAYLGGINISDHNREWHDFMVKVSDRAIHEAVQEDFTLTFNGIESTTRRGPFVTNSEVARSFFDLIAGARHEIVISSPYIVDKTVIDHLKDVAATKKVLTLRENNSAVIRSMCNYVYARLIRDGAEIYHYDRFSHAKFAMADRERLLIGSSNFGKDSFDNKQEVGLLITDKPFIDRFYQRMVAEQPLHQLTAPTFRPHEAILTHVYHVLLEGFRHLSKGAKPLG